jgi:aminopeptidase N
VLKQLVAFVGEDAFVQALRNYFANHAWANTTLDDLVGEVASASGRDLSGRVKGWLETSGTDRLTLERQDDGLTLVATPPAGRRAPLPHRLRIGAYADGDDGLTQVETLSVEVTGVETRIDGGSKADLLLVNDEDLTFASVQPDRASLELLLSRGGELPTAVGRTLALTTAWGLLYDGELTAQQVVDCGVGVLIRETADSVIEPALGLLVDTADLWSAPSRRDGLLSQVADLCISLAEMPDRRLAALRGLARSATTEAQLEALSAHVTEPDLRWRRLIRLDESDLEQLLAEDPDPDAWMNAARARAALPSAEAKAQAWQTVVVDRKIPPGSLFEFGGAFWRPGQEDLLTPYAEKFLQSLRQFGDSGTMVALRLSGAFYPAVGGEKGFLDRLSDAAGDDGVRPVVRQKVRERNDRRRRREIAHARE